eukprot:SAG22_NODE_132_length_18535_cov_8.178021_7_plen_257_part_00
MTTVQKFGAAVNSTLNYLEDTLPRGSTVILIGLAEGTTLYNVTHNQTHPIGTSYPALYDYLSCLGVNPCWGWLNTNATWRAATQARADQLNREYGRIVTEWEARRRPDAAFDLLYFNPQLQAAISKYVLADPCADGVHCGKTRSEMDCIEPGDGFVSAAVFGAACACCPVRAPLSASAAHPHELSVCARRSRRSDSERALCLRWSSASGPDPADAPGRPDLGVAGGAAPARARRGQPLQRPDRRAVRGPGRLLTSV